MYYWYSGRRIGPSNNTTLIKSWYVVSPVDFSKPSLLSSDISRCMRCRGIQTLTRLPSSELYASDSHCMLLETTFCLASVVHLVIMIHVRTNFLQQHLPKRISTQEALSFAPWIRLHVSASHTSVICTFSLPCSILPRLASKWVSFLHAIWPLLGVSSMIFRVALLTNPNIRSTGILRWDENKRQKSRQSCVFMLRTIVCIYQLSKVDFPVILVLLI